MQLTAPLHHKGFGAIAWFNLQPDIHFGFSGQTATDFAAGQLFALLAGQRGIVHAKGHGQGGGVNGGGGQGVGHRLITHRVAYKYLGQASQGDDIASQGLLHRAAGHATEGQNFGDAAALQLLTIAIQQLNLLIHLNPSAVNTTRDQAANIVVALHHAGQHRKGRIQLHRW